MARRQGGVTSPTLLLRRQNNSNTSLRIVFPLRTVMFDYTLNKVLDKWAVSPRRPVIVCDQYASRQCVCSD